MNIPDFTSSRTSAKRTDPGPRAPAPMADRRGIRHGAGPMDPGSAPPAATRPERRADAPSMQKGR